MKINNRNNKNLRSMPWHLSWIVLLLSANIACAEKPAVPFVNPYLADSTFPITHAQSDFTPIAGPTGPGRRLGANEVVWKKVGPVNGFIPVYSGLYPNGKRVMWVGGYDRVAKLDADTLDVLTTYAIGGDTYFSEEEIERQIATMDQLDDAARTDYTVKLWRKPAVNSLSFYRMLSRDNELYFQYRKRDGSVSMQVYGETDAKNPASEIELRREWKIPAEFAGTRILGLNMTSDGWIVMATTDGTLIALARDFKTWQTLKLPRTREEAPDQDVFTAFVRNNITTDDRGGIYIVTRDYAHRVQWTGSRLSLDTADGAWSVPYPNEKWVGSGTTPALMGWGDKEDHLVVFADGTKGNNMMAVWRDRIPDDWKGLPGYDRRVAGVAKIHFGVSPDEDIQVENALVVYGYGAFINNTYPVRHLPAFEGKTYSYRQWMSESLYMQVPGHEARGGAMIRWDPATRSLKQAWQSQINFVSTVCNVSGATELLYCWGARNREWTVEGLDWNSGKSAFVYTLGKSQRFNPLGGPIIVAPNGAIDCGCTGGLGMVRVQPKKGAK